MKEAPPPGCWYEIGGSERPDVRKGPGINLLRLTVKRGEFLRRDEALVKLDEFDPECILLDLELPDGNGVEVLKAIRGAHRPVKVAVISALEAGRPPFDGLAPDVVFQKPLAIARVNDWLSRAT